MRSAYRRRVYAGVCLGLAVAISVWLFSGDSRVPSSGTLGSYLADSVVVVLIVVCVSLVRRSFRAGRAS